MYTTASANVKSFASNQSYSSLKKNHLDLPDRHEAGFAKNENLQSLNMNFRFYTEEVEAKIVSVQKDLLDEYNAKPSQKKNPKRKFKSRKDFVQKQQAKGNVNKDFTGLDFMMIGKLGSKESWEEVVSLFELNGVSEEETLSSLNESFRNFGFWFVDEFSESGLLMVEMDTNLDEEGAPHYHSHLMILDEDVRGLPVAGFQRILKNKYGEVNEAGKKLTAKELGATFRMNVDTKLVEFCSESLVELAKSRGFGFEGLKLERKEAEYVGRDHELYKQMKDFEKKEEEFYNLKNEVLADQKILNVREKGLNDREAALRARETSFADEVKGWDDNTEKVRTIEAELLEAYKTSDTDQGFYDYLMENGGVKNQQFFTEYFGKYQNSLKTKRETVQQQVKDVETANTEKQETVDAVKERMEELERKFGNPKKRPGQDFEK